VTHNEKGEIEGVKYDRVGVVLINAIREQQSQIEALQKESLEVRARLATLEVVCSDRAIINFKTPIRRMEVKRRNHKLLL